MTATRAKTTTQPHHHRAGERSHPSLTSKPIHFHLFFRSPLLRSSNQIRTAPRRFRTIIIPAAPTYRAYPVYTRPRRSNSPLLLPLLPFLLRVLSAPLPAQKFLHHIMRLPPPIPFSFPGITNRLSIHSRLFASNAASGPAPPSHRPTYNVPRNSRGTLPVYSDIRNGGTRYLISVRNVDGNIKVSDPTLVTNPFASHSHQNRHWLMTSFATFPTLNHQSQLS